MHVDPTRAQFDAFKALPRDTPIMMINLVRYRDDAAYPDDHPYAAEGLTGTDAYRRYSKESGPIFVRVGGTILWTGKPEIVLTGPSAEQWDAAFVARYPDAAAFLEMVTDPDYRAAVINRQAAVLDSRLIRCGERGGSGQGFG